MFLIQFHPNVKTRCKKMRFGIPRVTDDAHVEPRGPPRRILGCHPRLQDASSTGLVQVKVILGETFDALEYAWSSFRVPLGRQGGPKGSLGMLVGRCWAALGVQSFELGSPKDACLQKAIFRHVFLLSVTCCSCPHLQQQIPRLRFPTKGPGSTYDP